MNTTNFVVNKDKRQVVMERTFDASVKKVWQAHVNPELVIQWWGPRKMEMTIDKFEVRPGGAWRILHKDPSGKEHWFSGQYQEVIEPEKIVRTFIYEPESEHVLTETCIFKPLSETRTKMTYITDFPAPEALDGMVNAGMESGAREGLERLSKLVETN
jgi:uncharacterized protein YndB with AHSA1/START domain